MRRPQSKLGENRAVYKYDAAFYRYINEGARASAEVLVPALLGVLSRPVDSVLDVGCGAGAWLSVWKSRGARVTGLDGSYVDPAGLLIDAAEFTAADLSQPVELRRSFDLVQSLEVAEHLPGCAAATFVESLCRHAPLVLFSAAPPGQGGENHINEQPYAYWRELFRQRGYHMYDPVRAALAGCRSVKPWYRYNTFLYASERCPPALLKRLAPYRVDELSAPADVSPPLYRLRKRLIRLLPPAAATWLAVLKKHLNGLSLKPGRAG